MTPENASPAGHPAPEPLAPVAPGERILTLDVPRRLPVVRRHPHGVRANAAASSGRSHGRLFTHYPSSSIAHRMARDGDPVLAYIRSDPELHDALLDRLPSGSVVDGEIVIATPTGLDLDLLRLRLHPAASRVELLAMSPLAVVSCLWM